MRLLERNRREDARAGHIAAAAMNAMTRKRDGDMWQPTDFFPSLKDESVEALPGGMAARFRSQIAAYKGPTTVGKRRRK